MANGTMRTPFPMTVAERAVVEECFTRLLGRPITLAQRVDRSLIGGVRVTVDGLMYDGSIKARLASVKRLLEIDEEGQSGA